MADISAKQVKELRDRTGVGMMDAKKALVEVDGDMDKAVDLLREKGMASADKKADRVTAEGLTYVHANGNRAAVVELNSETDYVAKNEQFQTLVENVAKAVVEAAPSDMDEANAAKLESGETVDEAIKAAISTIGENITFRRFRFFEKNEDENFGLYDHMNGNIGVITVIKGGNEDVARDVAMHVAAINPQYMTRDDVPEEAYNHEKEIQIEKAKNEGKPENIVEKMVEGRMQKWLGDISLVDQEFVKDSDLTVQEYLGNNDAEMVDFVRFQVGEGLEKRVENLAEEVAKELGQ